VSPTSGGATRVRSFRQLGWFVLGYAVLVIVWGAVVRATGSGAGCGNHWPLCNGDVVPLAPRAATIIEYAHRLTSALILIFVAILWGAAVRAFPRGHGARRAAMWSTVFVLIEAGIGAGIVLLQLVENNASALRAGYIAVHLMNTMFLVAALTATVWWGGHAGRPVVPPRATGSKRLLLAALVAMLIVSASGAVVALGDTLFPELSLAAGLAADFDPASHFLIRLRMWHPVLAVGVGLYLIALVTRASAFDDPALIAPGRWILWLVAGQVALGVINLVTLAPLTLQMAHLAVANLLWIATVWAFLAHADVVRDSHSPAASA
jgi:heme a synthase